MTITIFRELDGTPTALLRDLVSPGARPTVRLKTFDEVVASCQASFPEYRPDFAEKRLAFDAGEDVEFCDIEATSDQIERFGFYRPV